MKTTTATPHPSLKLKIAGMDCGSCATTIAESIRKLPGVEQADVSFTTENLYVTGDIKLDAIQVKLKELGYKIVANNACENKSSKDHRGASGFVRFLWQQPMLRLSVIVAIVVIIGLLSLSGMRPVMGIEPLTGLLVAAIIIAGGPVFLKGMRALLFAHRITIDLLMAIACVGALAIGEYGEAVTVILLFILGESLESYSAERARDSLRSLMGLQPQHATVISNNCNHHSGEENCSTKESHQHPVTLPIEQVTIGARVLVRPGQRIPVDGIVISGLSTVNQAPVTGESIPVLKTPDDEVMAGTVNGEAALEIRCTELAADGTIARIARLVEQAQSQRSPAERFIDKFARWYTPAVVVLASLIVIIPVYCFNQPLMTTGDNTGWLYRGLAMLIIACPCALVISIPVTVVSGLSRLSSLGILVKGGAQLDSLADIKAIAFDKTGTLTHGRPRVSGIRSSSCVHPTAADNDCHRCDDLIAIAASVESASEHPIAHAIVEAAQSRSSVIQFDQAEGVQAYPGKGVSGILANGKTIKVGTGDLFNESMAGWQDISAHAEAAKQRGETVMYVNENDTVKGYIGVQDEIRETSTQALNQLGKMHIRNIMLTGDHRLAAERVANQIKAIDEVHAQLLPAEKLQAIEYLQQQRGSVAMVGDGINDAPALARADIGIAMGSGGTAQAMETADIVLMNDDLRDVPLALTMAKKSRRIIKQNITLSLALKLVFLTLAIPGIATLWMAVLADVGATLLVTFNGMRLLKLAR